jgi:septal ring factor EnvC (AmiA/AmiB activator)
LVCWGRRWLAVLLVACLAFSATGLADQDVAKKARELENLRVQIRSIQKRLEAGRAKKSRAEARLSEIEREINEVGASVRRIDGDLETNRRRLVDLQARREAQQRRLQRQRQVLAAEARAAFLMGRQQQVKLLLNQEQPASIGRMLVYFHYLSRARSEQIDAVHSTLAELQELESSIGEQTRSLSELRQRREDETRRLQARKRIREQAVAALTRELRTQGDELGRLKRDERQLQELLSSLREVLREASPTGDDRQLFRSRKGKLRWPASGELAKRFGTRRGSTGLKWRGVLIAAPEGGKVRAVSQGRVAFADWMRGFGLLLIIDHGDGYMSLYGHNQALYKEVGERVDTGEVVAALGASGGQMESGLYFELRHQGRPINPASWCAGEPGGAPG